MKDSAFVILLEILLAFLAVAIVLGNIFVIQTVLRNTQLKTIPNMCITSLAVADLFVGLVNVPMYMYAVYANEMGIFVSRAYGLSLVLLDIFFGCESIAHLTSISVERCYAITCPMRRRFLRKGNQGIVFIDDFLYYAI